MSNVDRARAARLMAASGLDALVINQPESFAWATGAVPGPAAMWRRFGGAAALIPADPAHGISAVVSDLFAPAIRAAAPGLDLRTHPIWVDTVDLTGLEPGDDTAAWVAAAHAREGRGPGHARPSTYDPAVAAARLGDLLAAAGLSRARVGVDLDFLPVADLAILKAALPNVDWRDGSDVIRRLKVVKTAREIGLLRDACAFAETGLAAMSAAIRPGVERAELAATWKAATAAAAAKAGRTPTALLEYISVGPDPWIGKGTVAPGHLIKADVACVLEGYMSDEARTYSWDDPGRPAHDIYKVMRAAFETGIAMFRPGVRLADIHRTVIATVHAAGYPGYARGHFGHGLGAGVGSEEWPFIAADSDVTLEPGMVLAFETPFYAKGLGAVMVEDMLVVTDDGAEVLSALPRDLQILG